MHRNFIGLVALTLAAPALATQSAPNSASRTFAADISAHGITRLALRDAVGTVHVSTTNDNAIRVRAMARPGGHAHFIFDWTWGNETLGELPKGLHLVRKRVGSTIILCLASKQDAGCDVETKSGHEPVITTPSGKHTMTFGNHHHGWKTDWTVSVPPRLALALKLGVGHGEIRGITGGLKTNIGVGHIEAELPRGPVESKIGVGHVDVRVGSADYGKVDLSAGVGNVSFEVSGKSVGHGYEHHASSAEQTIHGGGQTAYTLHTGVGHVKLELGVAGLSSMAPLESTAAATVSAPATASASTSPLSPRTATPATTSAATISSAPPATTTPGR